MAEASIKAFPRIPMPGEAKQLRIREKEREREREREILRRGRSRRFQIPRLTGAR